MSVSRMCELGQVSRAGFCRFDPCAKPPDDDLKLRDAIQKIALEFPCCGRPRITAELKRRGWEVNHKRVGRIMREDNLLCLRRRKFVMTTDSNHSLRVYPHLARDMEPTGIDQLWRADITYIRLETEFVYLAVVLDAYSRRVVGWALDRHLEDDLAIAALQMALQRRQPSEGLTHHWFTGRNTATWPKPDPISGSSLKRSITASGCIRPSAICRRSNSNVRCLFLLHPPTHHR